MSGAFPASYGNFAGRAGPALDALAGRDDGLGGALTDAAAAARGGRGQSGAVVNGAAADTTALAPWSGTPAGQKVLLTQLRGRLAQQQQVLAAYKARDARLAAVLRSMAYRSRLGGAGMPLSPSGLGAGPGGSGRGPYPDCRGYRGCQGWPTMPAIAATVASCCRAGTESSRRCRPWVHCRRVLGRGRSRRRSSGKRSGAGIHLLRRSLFCPPGCRKAG